MSTVFVTLTGYFPGKPYKSYSFSVPFTSRADVISAVDSHLERHFMDYPLATRKDKLPVVYVPEPIETEVAEESRMFNEVFTKITQ